MNSLRKWLYKPKKTDNSLLAQFYYADEELNLIAAELDSFDGRKDPERCTALVNQLRLSQDKVLGFVENIMAEVIPDHRASRDFRVKFPDDVLQENLAGQLWFGAECLAAGSNIMNREVESASMRPLAKAMTRHLDFLRSALRDQCLRSIHMYTDKIKEALRLFDRLFAEFELSYVSAMVPVKTMKEYDILQDVAVLFCETVQRALHVGLLTQDMIDGCEPCLMFTIPRLAIICGLVVLPEGPVNPDMDLKQMSEMFRPFRILLYKIRELLWTLTDDELWVLEKALCSNEEPDLNSIPRRRKQVSLSTPFSISSSNSADNSFSAEDYCDVGVQTDEEMKVSNFISHKDTSKTVGESSALPVITTSDLGEDQEQPEAFGYSSVQHQSKIVQHQESQDSGMPSEYGSVQDCRPSENAHPARYRRLRHSSSWPETQRSRFNNGVNQSALLDSSTNVSQDLLSSTIRMQISKSESESLQNTQRSFHCSQEFKVSLPANSANNSRSDCHREIRSQRVVYTSDCYDMDEVDSDKPPQVSYVTEELSNSYPVENCENVCDNSDQRSVSEGATAVDIPDGSRQTITFPNPVPHHTLDSNEQYSSAIECLTESLAEPCSQKRKTLQEIAKEPVLKTDNNPENNCNRCEPDILKHNSGCSPQRNSQQNSGNIPHNNPDSSSFNSDDEEVHLAVKAAEDAVKYEARSKFKNSTDLIHRLFVCISGVADQLQTNYAADLRHILKLVFECHSSNDEEESVIVSNKKSQTLPELAIESTDNSSDAALQEGSLDNGEDPPMWVPDEESPHCTACKVPFTFVRRRHHCRNCGRVFCGRCSANTVPLPHYGHAKPVRVCNHCFMFQVTPFTVAE